MPDTVSERWVSVEEVATHVGVRKESIYRWIEGRALPATKIGKLWKLKLIPVIIITAGRQDDGTQGPVLRKPLDIGKLVDAIQGAISQ
jgi:excisionase family DNA binding protein